MLKFIFALVPLLFSTANAQAAYPTCSKPTSSRATAVEMLKDIVDVSGDALTATSKDKHRYEVRLASGKDAELLLFKDGKPNGSKPAQFCQQGSTVVVIVPSILGPKQILIQPIKTNLVRIVPPAGAGFDTSVFSAR